MSYYFIGLAECVALKKSNGETEVKPQNSDCKI